MDFSNLPTLTRSASQYSDSHCHCNELEDKVFTLEMQLIERDEALKKKVLDSKNTEASLRLIIEERTLILHEKTLQYKAQEESRSARISELEEKLSNNLHVNQRNQSLILDMKAKYEAQSKEMETKLLEIEKLKMKAGIADIFFQLESLLTMVLLQVTRQKYYIPDFISHATNLEVWEYRDDNGQEVILTREDLLKRLAVINVSVKDLYKLKETSIPVKTDRLILAHPLFHGLTILESVRLYNSLMDGGSIEAATVKIIKNIIKASLSAGSFLQKESWKIVNAVIDSDDKSSSDKPNGDKNSCDKLNELEVNPTCDISSDIMSIFKSVAVRTNLSVYSKVFTPK
jgi:hypothetical protein